MLRIENLLLRGDGQVTQGRMLEETSLVQGPVENGGVGGGSGGGGGGGGGSGGTGLPVTSGAPSGAPHESELGALGANCICFFCSGELGRGGGTDDCSFLPFKSGSWHGGACSFCGTDISATGRVRA